MSQPQIDPRQVLEARVLLVAPSLSYFRGYYQIPKDDTVKITIQDTEVDQESLTTNRAVLFHKTFPVDRQGKVWKKRFQNIESREKALIEKYSVPFSIRGVRIIPKASAAEFLDKMFGLTVGGLRRRLKAARDNNDLQSQIALERILDSTLGANPDAENSTPVYDSRYDADEQSVAFELHTAAEEFCDSLDDIYEQISRRLDPTVWAAISGKLPRDRRKMRKKFQLDITPVELAGGTSNYVTAEDLSEHSLIVRETCQRRVAEAIDSMISGPRNELAEALANLQKLIADDGRVTAKSFAPVRAAIAKIRMFDFCANDTLLQQIKAIETRLDKTAPGDLTNTTAAQNGFSAALNSVMTEVQSEASYQQALDTFGSAAARTLDLD